MTQREKYRRFFNREPGAPTPNLDHGPLLAAYERWLEEGLNPELDPRDFDTWCDAWGLDRYPARLSIPAGKAPLYAEEVLEEDADTVTIRKSDGSVIHDNKGSHKSIPHVIRPAVVEREDWERLKAWLDPDGPLPPPEDPGVAPVLEKARTSDGPVALGAGSLMGRPRDWFGFEEYAVLPYEDEDWMEEVTETACRLAERQVRYFGEQGAPVDTVHFWEDICFKNGPIITPHVFQEMVVPRYRRVAELAGSFGCDVVSVDSDGNIDALLEGWLEGGVNVLWPLEAQAGMDVNELQDRYGDRVVWMGNIHKHRLTGGEAAIAGELERLRPAVERGGYIPMLDHCCPQDVSFENFQAYMRLRHEILGLGRPFDPAAVRR